MEPQGSFKGEEGGGKGRKGESERWEPEKDPADIAGFEDGKQGPQAKACGQSLEARKDKETDSPLEPPEGPQPCQHVDFSPTRPNSDLCLPEARHCCWATAMG